MESKFQKNIQTIQNILYTTSDVHDFKKAPFFRDPIFVYDLETFFHEYDKLKVSGSSKPLFEGVVVNLSTLLVCFLLDSTLYTEDMSESVPFRKCREKTKKKTIAILFLSYLKFIYFS
jgi:hypothetical protein